nr:MAG TPA: hypothetical protein [Caudoviricetes sp.]
MENSEKSMLPWGVQRRNSAPPILFRAGWRRL